MATGKPGSGRQEHDDCRTGNGSIPVHGRAQALLDPELIVNDRRWHRLVPQARLLVARAARLGGGAGSVLLTTGRAVHRLNARYRGRNKPTNVLTFEPASAQAGGDIVVAFDIVRHEAEAAGRRPSHHLAHLILHGALHLRGHGHHGAGEARRMELREAWLLRRMRVPNPWNAGSPLRPAPSAPSRIAPGRTAAVNRIMVADRAMLHGATACGVMRCRPDPCDPLAR